MESKKGKSKLIVIRTLDKFNDEEDQLIFCNDNCYFQGKKLITDNYNLYSNWLIDDEKFRGVYSLIEETFLSSDYKEYCNECEKQLNMEH